MVRILSNLPINLHLPCLGFLLKWIQNISLNIENTWHLLDEEHAGPLFGYRDIFSQVDIVLTVEITLKTQLSFHFLVLIFFKYYIDPFPGNSRHLVWSPPAHRPSDKPDLVESDPTTRCPGRVSIPGPLPLESGALLTELSGAPMFFWKQTRCIRTLRYSIHPRPPAPYRLGRCLYNVTGWDRSRGLPALSHVWQHVKLSDALSWRPYAI